MHLGITQLASGSHSGIPNGSESPNIDNPWVLLGSTGMHSTTSPVTILSDDGAGNVTIDMSGWRMTWNYDAIIDLGSGDTTYGYPESTAVVTCAIDCSYGDSYILDYAAKVGPGSTLTGLDYWLHLEGTIVPIPSAVWLFGSGLLGLIGVARRMVNA